jgi:deoxyribodipyrimidine photo-lyase
MGSENKKFKNVIYLFRRDLRIFDNTALNTAIENSNNLIPLFIFNENQVTNKNNFYNPNSIQFMLNSLTELNLEIPINFFYGNQIKILKSLIISEKIDAIFQNYDYTPFARIRDKKIKELCTTLKIQFIQTHDYLLNEPSKILKSDKTPYAMYTPYYRQAILIPVKQPQKINLNNTNIKTLKTSCGTQIFEKILKKENYNKNLLLQGGRKEALKLLTHTQKLTNFETSQNFPNEYGTSRLSSHLKFGTISPRETFHILENSLGINNPINRQLHWRDFWTYIQYHKPHVYTNPYNLKYEKLEWIKNNKHYDLWCQGKTGFPIVDAGMRELNKTGFMHNRVRMIVASFLTKDLHIDYKLGEKYFAQKLIDYDPAVNNGNWQWSASTGCDAQPYFRVFNPWLQQKKFDKNCEYIKKCIPELQNTEPKQLHNIFKNKLNLKNYPNPIVEHDIESKIAKEIFRTC